MNSNYESITDKCLTYGANIIKVCSKLEKSIEGKCIIYQLFRAGTSVGANYEEACGAESKADFIHKLQIALKEAKESIYWLKLIEKSGLLKTKDIEEVLNLGQQLANIIGKSIVTAKTKK